MQELIPFSAIEASTYKVAADLKWSRDQWLVTFRIVGPIESLVLPPTAIDPQFSDGLWQSTCMEVFLKQKDRAAYEEWNLSPSGNWAHYSFSDYRLACLRSLALKPLNALIIRHSAQELNLQAALPRSDHWDQTKSDEKFVFGLTCILEPIAGTKQYWALHHSSDRPDFHQAASFRGEGSFTSPRL